MKNNKENVELNNNSMQLTKRSNELHIHTGVERGGVT